MIGERYNKYHSFYENFSDNKELKMFFKKESYTSTINSLIAYSEDGDEAKRSFKDSAFYIKSKDFLKKLWLNIRIIFQKIKMFITNLLDKILKREKSSKIKVIIDSIKDINSKLDKMEKSFGKNKYLALLGKQVNISEIYLNKDFIDTINRNLNMACKSLLGDGGSYKGLLVYTQKYLNDYNRGRTGNIEWKKEYLDYIKYGQDINTYNPGYIDDYMTHEFGKEKSNEEIFGTNTYTLYDFFDKVQKPWKNLSSTMLNVENQLYKIEKVGRPLIKKLSSILALFKEWESTPTYDEDYEDLMSDYYDADEKAAREERYRFFRITIENLNNILSGLKTSTKAIYDNINVLYEYIIKKRKIIYSVMIEGEKVIVMTDLEKLKNSYNNLNNKNEGYSEGDSLFPKKKKK